MFKFLSWNKSKHVDILSMIWIQLVLTTSILVLIIMVMWYMICIEVLELYTWLSLGRPACMYRFFLLFLVLQVFMYAFKWKIFFSPFVHFSLSLRWNDTYSSCSMCIDRFQGLFFFPFLIQKKKNVCKLGLKKGLVKEGLKLLTHTHSWDYV